MKQRPWKLTLVVAVRLRFYSSINGKPILRSVSRLCCYKTVVLRQQPISVSSAAASLRIPFETLIGLAVALSCMTLANQTAFRLHLFRLFHLADQLPSKMPSDSSLLPVIPLRDVPFWFLTVAGFPPWGEDSCDFRPREALHLQNHSCAPSFLANFRFPGGALLAFSNFLPRGAFCF